MIGRPIAFWLALVAGMATAAPPVVSVNGGRLAGREEGGIAVFRGVPYAAPPVGAARWRPPGPVRPWAGIRSASGYGHSCWQAVSPRGFGPWTHEYVVGGDVSEDCLFLNVWTPAHADKAPVLVWIHGGGFNSGSGAIPIYDGRALAKRGLVVVTINYRVGVFGFLQHPRLTAEAATGPIGNFGLQDMVAALRWVRANIAAFGGDPTAVTVAGQSAGGMAVGELLAVPAARGLFQRAIIESGLPRPLPSLREAERDGQAFAMEKGAGSLGALRTAPAEALQPDKGANSLRFRPSADGRWLAPVWRPVSDVPTLTGYTADEASALSQDYGSDDPAKLQALLAQEFGADADRWSPLYPTTSAAATAEANRQAHRDGALAGLFRWDRTRRAAGSRTPAYAYLFTHRLPGPESARWGAFHSSEIPYVFGTLDAAPERAVTATDRRLSDTMACYWVAFIRTGRPACPGQPVWPALSPDRPRLMRLDTVPAAEPLLPPDKLRLVRESGAASPRP